MRMDLAEPAVAAHQVPQDVDRTYACLDLPHLQLLRVQDELEVVAHYFCPCRGAVPGAHGAGRRRRRDDRGQAPGLLLHAVAHYFLLRHV